MADISSLTFRFRVTYCDHGAHVAMTNREHDTDALDCWCSPTYSLPCDECSAGCWKCENGSIHLTREEAGHADSPLVIVHNAK